MKYLYLQGQFKEMWNKLFDTVKIRQVKRVSGKCWACAYINELRQLKKGKESAEACKHLMIMHRGGLFMLERIEYRRRIAEAVLHFPNTVMSSIIDGASQNHCTIPHPGPNVEFADGPLMKIRFLFSVVGCEIPPCGCCSARKSRRLDAVG